MKLPDTTATFRSLHGLFKGKPPSKSTSHRMDVRDPGRKSPCPNGLSLPRPIPRLGSLCRLLQ